VAALSGAAGCADAVANSAGIFVQVNPATVNAGAQTQVTASCGDNVNAATVSSTAFGSQTLQPVGGVLTTTATVTPETAPGTYGVRLACPTGSQATTTLTVIGGGTPASQAPGPGTGGGFLADHDDPGGQASAPADRTPLVWLGAGLGCLLAAAAVAVRAQRRATVRSALPRSRRDQENGGPR
jgi:hypothetical protein